jgi:hypothetical protein
MDNFLDALKKRRIPRGEGHHSSKLTILRVRQMRQLRKLGFSYYWLGKTYGVAWATAKVAVLGLTWKEAGSS